MSDLPPPPPIQCIKAQDASRAFIRTELVVSGDPMQIEEWLKQLQTGKNWKVDADLSSPTFRSVRLITDDDVRYRELGGLIYEGQTRRLAITVQLTPPICEAEDD